MEVSGTKREKEESTEEEKKACEKYKTKSHWFLKATRMFDTQTENTK